MKADGTKQSLCLPVKKDGAFSYPIYLEESFVNLPERIKELDVANKRICIVTDSNVEKIYAKGSIVYGTMLPGSDIDHLRIKVKKRLTLNQKKELVSELEKSLEKYNISKLQRIKEDNYVRVLYDYVE